MADLEDLIEPETTDSIEETIYAAAEADGLPTTQWQALSFARTLIRIFAQLLATAWYSVVQIVNGMILGRSAGAWLTLLARSQYALTRAPAVATEGTVTLTSASVGHTIAAGDLIVATADGVRFRNLTGGTLLAGGTLDVDVQAMATGSAGNVSVGTITVMETALSSVTVDNPEIGVTGTWITTFGSDSESDGALTTRAQAQWATLSTGSPPTAYVAWALEVTGVTRAALDDEAPDGPGTTRLYIDASGLVATVQAIIDAKVPAGSSCTVVAASTTSISVGGVVTVRRDFRAAAESAINAALAAYELEVDIGGIVREAEIVERVMTPDGVVDFALATSWTGSPNVQLGANSIPVFSISLTFVEV